MSYVFWSGWLGVDVILWFHQILPPINTGLVSRKLVSVNTKSGWSAALNSDCVSWPGRLERGVEGNSSLWWCHSNQQWMLILDLRLSCQRKSVYLFKWVNFWKHRAHSTHKWDLLGARVGMGGYQLMQIVLGPSKSILGQSLSQLFSKSPEYLSPLSPPPPPHLVRNPRLLVGSVQHGYCILRDKRRHTPSQW